MTRIDGKDRSVLSGMAFSEKTTGLNIFIDLIVTNDHDNRKVVGSNEQLDLVFSNHTVCLVAEDWFAGISII